MSEESKQRVIEKVRNLFNKTTDNGATEAEVQTAMDIAARMMGKYHLTEEDLAHDPADDYAKVDQATFNDSRSFIGCVAFLWESWLAKFVSDFVGCPYYIDNDRLMIRKNGFVQFDEKDNPKYGKSFVFFGVPEDAALAAELYDELRMLIATLAVAKWGTVYKGDGGSYSEGFVLGLFNKLETSKKLEYQEAGSSSTALTLIARRDGLIKYKENKAKDWLKDERGVVLRKCQTGSGANGSRKAYSEGLADGRSADVSAVRRRKIAT